MNELGVKIGNIKLKNPLICGSGEHFIELEGIQKALEAGAAAVVIKSTNESEAAKAQLEKTDYILLNSKFEKLPWNFGPPSDANLFNRSGLHPKPFDEWLEIASRADLMAYDYNAYAVASLIPASLDKMIDYAIEIENSGIRILEVNVGAPHGDEATPGAILLEREAARIGEITNMLRNAVEMPLWIKLTGQSHEIPAMVKAAKDAGADSVTIMGRHMAFIPDINTGKPMLNTHGAYGGSWALPLSCHWLVKSREIIGKNYSLMGTNGARSGHDIIRFMMSGATAVQMTSAIFTGGYNIINQSIDEIEKYLEQYNMNARDLIGLAADQVQGYHKQIKQKDHWRKFKPNQ